MNPFESILDNDYGDENYSGMDAAAVLLLRVMADNYKGDMPKPTDCGHKYRWCLAKLAKYRPNEFIDWMTRDWVQVCPQMTRSFSHD